MSRIFEHTAPVLILVAVLVIVSVLLLNHAFQPTMDGIEWQEETYIVRRGDSLWTISCSYCPDGVDCREWIDEIRALNGLSDSTIYPGQTLIVLAPVK